MRICSFHQLLCKCKKYSSSPLKTFNLLQLLCLSAAHVMVMTAGCIQSKLAGAPGLSINVILKQLIYTPSIQVINTE